MKSGYYLVCEPDGSMCWEHFRQGSDKHREIIGFDELMVIRTFVDNLVMLADVRALRRSFRENCNQLASYIFNGFGSVSGTVILCSCELIFEDEVELVPVSERSVRLLRMFFDGLCSDSFAFPDLPDTE